MSFRYSMNKRNFRHDNAIYDMQQRFLSYIICVVCSFCAVPNTANEIIAVDIKYIDWDIMTITDISPQDFESWNGYQLHITNKEIMQHLMSQMATLHRLYKLI